MSSVQIPNLTAAISLNGTELLEAVQAGTSVRVTAAQLASLANVGGGIKLENLTDVSVTEGAAIDGYMLTWDQGAGAWVATPVPPSITQLDGLYDVAVTEGPGIDGNVLTWDAGTSKWVAAVPVTQLDGLADVNVTEGPGIDGDVLTWDNGTSKWVATTPLKQLDQLLDVNVTEGAGIDGDVLTWDNGTGKWIATTPSPGVMQLDQLTDVSVTEGSGINGQYLKWDNGTSHWVAGKPTEIPTASVSATGSLSINRSTSEIQNVSLTGNVSSFTISGWPSSGTLARLVLIVANTGAYNINAWPSGTQWVGGSAPTVTSGSGKTDIYILLTVDGGATLYGTVVGQNYS